MATEKADREVVEPSDESDPEVLLAGYGIPPEPHRSPLSWLPAISLVISVAAFALYFGASQASGFEILGYFSYGLLVNCLSLAVAVVGRILRPRESLQSTALFVSLLSLFLVAVALAVTWPS